jgi:hypothetical protein
MNYVLLITYAFLSIFSFSAQSNESVCNSTKVDKFLEANYAKSIDITVLKSRKWNKNYLETLTTEGDILRKNKKFFKAKIVVLFNNNLKCNFLAKIRISGDHKDHISPSISSLDVKLLNGNINNIIKFKLFIPKTKNGDNEIVSTVLLKELGFLAPKTYYVPSTFNGKSTIFIFQEKITKEFVESNNLREAPILEGDERFFFDNIKTGFNRFGLARILNKNWANKGLTSLEISKIAISQLNKSYLSYLSEEHIYKNGKRSFLHINTKSGENFTNKDKEFYAILIAIDAIHALFPNNRKFYYDPIYKYFKPIYYDGNSSIVQLKNSMKNLRNLEGRLKNSIIIGAKFAITSLEDLDRKNFKNKLNSSGLNYSLKKVDTIINSVILNLRSITNYSTSEITKNLYTPYFSIYSDLIKDTDIKIVFSTIEELNIEVCDLSLTHCFYKTLDIKEYSKLLSGRYKDANNNLYIFIGNKYEYTSGISEQKYNKESRFKLGNKSEMYTYGTIKVLLDKDNRKITLYQNNDSDRVLIKGGKLKDWSIKLIGSTTGKKVKQKQRFNQNLLTGCLTLLDMYVNNVSIDISASSCEDGLNIIRTHGNFNNITIKNALSDALDVDFSKVSFNKININNAKNDCIDLSSGDYHINHARLVKCIDKGISVGEKSNLTIDFSQISESNIGITAKDSSVVEVGNLIANNVEICLSAYNKKQEFWGGKIIINKNNCRPNQILQQKGSLVEFVQ